MPAWGRVVNEQMLPNSSIVAETTVVARGRLRRALDSTVLAIPWSAWLASVVRVIRSDDYVAVAASPRFRARERRLQGNAAITGMLVILAAAAFDVVAFSAIHRSDGPLLIGLNLVMALLALASLVALRGPARRHPDLIVAAMSLLVAWVSAAIGILGTELVILALAYLLILPAIVALVVPARPRAHVRWLLVYAVAAFTFVLAAPSDQLTRVERVDVSVVLLISIVVSFLGSVIRFRGRASSHMHRTAMQALRHETEHQQVALVHARADLELAVRLDQLTQTGNRRRLEEDLLRARDQLRRGGGTFGLLELDIDLFKRVNDQFGHVVGDRVLRDVAAILKGASRATDVVYRFGGEEFIVLMQGADVAAVTTAAERLRAAVENEAIAHPDNPPRGVVTVSVGGAVIGPDDVDRPDEAWFDRADRALYRAKSLGRNRIDIEAADASAA